MSDHVCKFNDTVQSHFEDETLETIWELIEQDGRVDYAKLISSVGNEERLKGMAEKGLWSVKGTDLVLTDEGHKRAKDIIRRHRLAERLFADVLDIKDFEGDACLIEHAISPSVEVAICTLLGHPPRCPHNKEIPRGKCCSVYTTKVTPLTMPMNEMEVGREARVVFITSVGMDRLSTMGLVPGAIVKLQQKRPSYVIMIDETTLAIDEAIASGIYVKHV